MDFYCVDKEINSSGKHTVHRLNCDQLPRPASTRYLGYLGNTAEAISVAKKFFYETTSCTCCSINSIKERIPSELTHNFAD